MQLMQFYVELMRMGYKLQYTAMSNVGEKVPTTKCSYYGFLCVHAVLCVCVHGQTLSTKECD
jgi:hypothetical protein